MNATETVPAATAAAASPRRSPVSVKLVSKHEELVAVLNIRQRVFSDEIHLPPEHCFDLLDTWPLQPGVHHLLVSVASRPIATCRVNLRTELGIRLEHIAVVELARRKGVGLALLNHVERLSFVTESRGPLHCFALPSNEHFFRNSGWIVEEGHDRQSNCPVHRIAMVRRRPPLGVNPNSRYSLSHAMVYSMNLARSRRFYSLLGFQDVSRFKMGDVRGVWIESSYIDLKLELLEVRLLPIQQDSPTSGSNGVSDSGEMPGDNMDFHSTARRGDIRPGAIGHISLDLSRACTTVGHYIATLHKESTERFDIPIPVVQPPRQIVLGSLLAEVAFIKDPDGTLIELIRAVGTVRNREGDGSYHAAFAAR